MTGDAETLSSDQTTQNYATIRVAVGPLAAPVICRVVSMMAARADCPVDRLDDAMLLCDAIAAHAPRYVTNGHVTVEAATREDEIELRLGPLVADGATSLIDDANVPGVGNVLERFSDELRPERCEDGSRLIVKLRF